MLATERKGYGLQAQSSAKHLLFSYREGFDIDLPWSANINRPTCPKRIASVLDEDEVGGVLAQMDGVTALVQKQVI